MVQVYRCIHGSIQSVFSFQIFFFAISNRWPRVSRFFACIPEYRFRERRGCIIYMIVTIHPHGRVFILQCKFNAKWNKFNRRLFHYVSNWENLYIFRARLMNRIYNRMRVHTSNRERCLSLARRKIACPRWRRFGASEISRCQIYWRGVS